MENYIRGQSHHMLHICVDNYCDCGIKGRIFNDTLKENVLFTDIHHIFLECENLFDRNGNPLSSQQKRSFQKGKRESSLHCYSHKYYDYRDFLNEKGKVKTFDIIVKSRNNTSWQGILFCENEKENFSSELELIKIIGQYLQKD